MDAYETPILSNKGGDPSALADEKIQKAVSESRARLLENNKDRIHKKEAEIKRGRQRKTSTNSEKSQEEIQRLSEELNKMFQADNFRGVVRAPADVLLALTGNKIWDLPEEEVNSLAITGASCARYFLSSDPKWLALSLFSMTVLTTYGTRAAMHLAQKESKK